jgi:hypothetical protein
MAAEGLITLNELRTKLAGLEETRMTAEMEIENLRGRLERVEELERNRDSFLDSYVGLIPQKLWELEPEDRQRIYSMLRLRLVMGPDGSIEATGIIGAGKYLCESELTSTCEFQNTKKFELAFRVLMTEGGAERLALEGI